jgi:hypothetical protein
MAADTFESLVQVSQASQGRSPGSTGIQNMGETPL